MELLDEDLNGPTCLPPERRRYLRYRYLDNGEVVLVANGPNMESPQMRADRFRWEAGEKDLRAKRLLAHPPEDWTPWIARQVADRLRENAQLLREKARQIQDGLIAFDAPLGLVSEDKPPRSSEPGYVSTFRRPRP